MNQLQNILRDVRYISHITKTKNKALLIFISVLLSQLTAYTDIAIIAIFSALIANQFTNISIVNDVLNIILANPWLILFFVIFKFIFQYFQNMILKKIELTVNKQLKTHILGEIFNKRNYSVADSYFYINILSTHISFFYSSFAQFLNSLLQIFAYTIYLVISDSRTVITFGIGIAILFLPTKRLLEQARIFMNDSYETGQESNREVQRVVDNLFLIKILKKDNDEINRFNKTLESYNFNTLNNFKFGVINSFLPTFFTLSVLSIVLAFTRFAKQVSLDFIGVVLRLFQSLGILTNSLNKIINSHVHIEKFYELEKNKVSINKSNYKVVNKPTLGVENLSFKYFNSNDYIFENINFTLNKNTHTILTGPNGSGKSTLLGLLSGVFYADNGSVSTFSDKYGYIGPTPLIFESSLYENLMYGNSSNITEIEILELLRKLDTFKEEKNYDLQRKINNKSLSSGQMQKIAFVRALLAKPEILLLDEAVSNIDEASKQIIFQILKNQQVTIVNSTHEPDNFLNVDSVLAIEIINEKRVLKLRNN